VKTRRLQLACPACGSAEVVYSCTPNCCFNHVCADCGATFEPVTVVKAAGTGPVPPPESKGEAADPTVACARCDSIEVYSLESVPGAVCGACGAALAIEYTEIATA
jgi:hypothetical protein